jgi:hypothetical protein
VDFSVTTTVPPHSGQSSVLGHYGIGFETFTADGPISYWNSYVGVGQMGGQGTFAVRLDKDRHERSLRSLQRRESVCRFKPRVT